MPRCPKCSSAKVKVLEENGFSFRHCPVCGYDEMEEEATFPEGRNSQREKGRYSPYKTGGKRRTNK